MLHIFRKQLAKTIKLINYFNYGKVKLINIKKIKQPQKRSIYNVQIDTQQLKVLNPKQKEQSQIVQQSDILMNKLHHKINFNIKNAIKLKQIFSIQKRNKFKMTIGQYLSLYIKLMYILYANEDQIQGYKQKIQNFFQYIGSLILKDSTTPQQQIQFINISFKSNNPIILNKLLPICDKILQQFDEKSFQLIPIAYNIKLLFSLIKISLSVGRQNNKKFLKILRLLISYINNKKKFQKIQTKTIFDMIKQYISLYPSLVLSNQNIKFLIQQISKRKPNIGASLISQKLILTHISHSTLKKQIINTKPGNMQYNILFKINKNISKIFKLSKLCQKNAQDIPILIYNHFQFFSNLGAQQLAKLDMLQNYYNQIITSYNYLKKIYMRQIHKNDIQIAATFRLFNFLLTDKVLQKLPPGLLDQINKKILNQLYTNFTNIQNKQIQVLLVQLSLRKKFSNYLEVMNIFIDRISLRLGRYQRKIFIPFYLKLLKYPQYVQNIKSKNPTKAILKRFMNHIEQFKDSQVLEIIQNIKYIQQKNILIQIYRQSSNYNKMMSQQVTQQKLRSLDKPNFRVRKYNDDEQYLNESYKLRMIIRKKIANCLRKAKLMLDVEIEKDQIKQIFIQQWSFLKYTQIYSYEDIENILDIYEKLQIASDSEKQKDLLNFYRQKMEKQKQ